MHKLVTIQSDINDCGPAVIYSLVKYYRGYVSMEKIRLDTNLSREGVTAYDIVLTLERYGFEAHGLSLTLNDIKNVSRPMILHLDYKKYNHYVLLVRVKKDICTIMDPSKGLIKMSLDDLAKVWTRIAIRAIPSGAILKLDKKTSLFCLLKKLVCQNKKTVLLIGVLGIILNILELVLNYYFQFLINFSNYSKTLTIFLFVIIAKILSEYYFVNLGHSLSRKIDYTLLDNYLSCFLHLPLPNLEKATSGRTLKHIEDLQIIKEAILELLLKVSLTLLQFSGGLFLIMVLSPYLSILFLGLVIGYIFLKLIENKKINKYTNYLLNKTTEYQETLVDTVKNYKTIKDLNCEDTFINYTLQKNLDYLDYEKYYASILNKWHSFENINLELGNFLLISVGYLLSKNGNINLVNLFTFITLTNYLFFSLKSTMDIMPKYYYLKQSYLRISEFLDATLEKDKGLIFSNGDITFSHVSFTYNNGNKVIKNLNQIIKKGQKVILSGASGTGKSTLCKLLYRYYEPELGSIKINNIDIKNLKLSSLRENISYTSQDATLFNGTVLENIAGPGKPDIDKLNRVIKICLLEKLIDKLPNHLETNLKDNSNNISGGETERIILARSLYNLKSIMILDEALSQVDIKTEKLIIKNIKNNYPACTLIYITHKDVKEIFKNEISLS